MNKDMDRNQARVALLKVTMIVLVASTWVFWSFIFATRPEESASADALVELVRLPASLPASLPAQFPGMQPTQKTMDPIAMDIVKVPCWDKAGLQDTETSARWVRLVGNACDNAATADSVSVKNKSNGFSATVFPTQLKKNLTTDFIPLQAGRNDIVIRVNREEGAAVESQITFVRE